MNIVNFYKLKHPNAFEWLELTAENSTIVCDRQQEIFQTQSLLYQAKFKLQ